MYGSVEVDTDAALADACEVLHSLHERCAQREMLREGDSPEDLEWTRTPDGILVMPVREGFLMKYQDGAQWCLAMSWKHDYGSRIVGRAALVDLERQARDIQRYGPSGGPTYVGGAPRWNRFDDATWHAVALDGEMRLMPLEEEDGEHILLHARNDRSGSVAVLDIGDREDLQDAAEQGSDEAAIHCLKIWIDGQPRFLRCVAAQRILGVLEHGEERFVLGHLGGELFGLVGHVRDVIRHFRVYTFAELRRGDLGPVVAWDPSGSTAAAPSGSRPVPSEALRPDPLAKSKRTPARQLRGLELQHVLAHLTPTAPPTGAASSIVPLVFVGLRVLVQRGAGDLLLWASQLQDLLVRRAGVRVHCCLKIFNLALRVVAAHTPLLVRQGRRWLLRLGELLDPSFDLLESIVDVSPLQLDDLDAETGPVEWESARRRGPSHAQPNHPPPQSSDDAAAPDADRGATTSDDGGKQQPDSPVVSQETAAAADGPGEQAEGAESHRAVVSEATGEAASPSRGPPSQLPLSASLSPLAVAARLLPGMPKFLESPQSVRDWLDKNMQRLAQSRASARAPPKLAATEATRPAPRREGQPFRWTRRRR